MTQAQFNGHIRAYANETNPLQTEIELTLTDFHGNKNKQAIPQSEAENIIRTALNMPIKIYYRNGKQNGHANAYPIGTLAEVWQDGDEIKARSILWRDEYPKEDEFLRAATAEGKVIGTSWEIYYEDSETIDGIEYLKACVFAATVIVENPAYGDRTVIYSVAESMNEIEQIYSDLCTLLNAVSELYHEMMEEEYENQQIVDTASAIARLQEMLPAMVTKMKEMKSTSEQKIVELQTTLDTAKAELEQIKTEKALAEKQVTEDRLYLARSEQLEHITIKPTREFILSLTDDQFTQYVESVTSVAKASAEHIRVPDPLGSNRKSIQDIAKALKEVK